MKYNFPIIYPASKSVTAARVFVWALDAADTDKLPTPTTMREAIHLLEDIGWITFTEGIRFFLGSPDADRPVTHWDLFSGEVEFS